MADMEEPLTPYAAMFDELSGVYDQTGVPFFSVMARGLVDRLRVRPGEKALDIGSGRGAVTRPLAEDVGPTGRVDAVDLAPGMVRLLGEDTAHLAHVHVTQGNAADPRPPAPPYDVIASSMVIFFLDDPTAALTPVAGVAASGRPRRGRDLPAVGRRLERPGCSPRRVRRGASRRPTTAGTPTRRWRRC